MLESLFDKVAGLKACIFIEKETLTQVFFCEYCEIIENSFFIEHLLLIILFRNFYVMIEFFGRLWVQNWYFSYFLCHCFVFFFITLVLESGVHGYFVLVFILKFLVRITFARSTTLESEATSSIIATSPSNLHCVKSVKIRSFFWSVFSSIQTEYGEIRSISPYSVRMRENTDQKKLHIWTLFP